MASKTFCGAIAAVAMLTFCGTAFASKGTPEQREACTPDAFRLCGQFIPDEDRIEACLRAAGPRLSPACYIVFHPDETVGRSPPPRPGLRRAPPQQPPPPRPYDDDWDD
ncbi:hypothetical protein ACSVBT_06415 [Afipia sp. TerB]